MGILAKCSKILDACDVASHNRGNNFFTISFPGEEWFLPVTSLTMALYLLLLQG